MGALERNPRDTPPVAAKVTGEVEARMIQIACSDPVWSKNSDGGLGLWVQREFWAER